MEGISVLHGEFTHSDKAASGSRLVAELSLDLIYHKGIFVVAVGVFPDKLHGCLLMSHAEHHGDIVPVGESEQLAADSLISAGFIPERSGHNDRELYLLTADSVHLFSDYILDFSRYPSERHKGGIDAVCDILHISAPEHESVAVYHAIRGLLLKSFADEFVNFHLAYLRENHRNDF